MVMHVRGKMGLVSILIALMISMLSCTPEMRRDINNLDKLRKAMRAEYVDQDINLTLWNGDALQVKFVNSTFNDLPDVDRRTKAREIAQFALENYAQASVISSVDVTFIIHKRYFGIFSYTNSLDHYPFQKDELKQGNAGWSQKWVILYRYELEFGQIPSPSVFISMSHSF